MGKFNGLFERLTSSGIVKREHVLEPGPVADFHLNLVHTERYFNGIKAGSLEAGEWRRLGLPWSPELARRSVLASQGTINAAFVALEDGISGNLAGGTHHAFPDHGEGFCVFNDVAIAIRVLKSGLWIKKALVLDCDVHQGNGTAAIFEHDPSVFTFSIHGQNNFPFRKKKSDLDVGLADGTGDLAYLDALEHALDQIKKSFSADIIFYLGGIDVLKGDRFGRLALSLAGLRERDRMVIRFASKSDIPLVLVLSGGYAPSVVETVAAHAIMFEEAVSFSL